MPTIYDAEAADIRADIELCVLDALRMDDRAPTREDLRRRYGFTQEQVDAHGDAGIAAGTRAFERDPGPQS